MTTVEDSNPMLNDENLSPEARERWRLIQLNKREVLELENKFLRDLGVSNSAPADPVTRMATEDAEATLYDRMTSAELTELFLNDRPRWKEILDAKAKSGMRKLFGGR